MNLTNPLEMKIHSIYSLHDDFLLFSTSHSGAHHPFAFSSSLFDFFFPHNSHLPTRILTIPQNKI